MKKFRLLLFLLVLMLLFSGCSGQNVESLNETPTTVVTEPAINPVDVYMTAADNINSLPGVELKITTQKIVFVDQQNFAESMDYTVTYSSSEDNEFIAKMTGDVQFGDSYSIPMEEIYYEGSVYGELDVFGYRTEMEQNAFLNRHAPVILLDASAYSSIEIDDNTISFNNAERLEDWLYREGYELIDASGTCVLDDQESLVGFTYTASYYYGTVRYEVQYSMDISEFAGIVEKPSQYKYYQEVPTVDTPFIIERAY